VPRVIPIGLSVSSISKAQKEISEILAKWEKVASAVLERLAQRGYDKATVKFGNSIYAGDKGQIDITTEIEGNTLTIKASGEKVLFIEFGAGIRYENPHMEDFGFAAGMYGKGHGNNPHGWYYKGSLGDNHPQDTDVATNPKLRERGLIHTFGSPANMPMYETEKELIDEIRDIVMEVWNGK
jgi:hypothetical protein